MLPEGGKDEREIYTYGVWVLITSLFDVIEVLILGVLFHRLPEAIIYLAILMVLRSYTGGFHASTFGRCNAMVLGCYLMNLVLSWGIVLAGGCWITLILLFVSVGYICYAAPVEHANKALTDAEKIRYRKYSILLSIAILVVVLLLYQQYEQQMSYAAVTMAMVAFMMLLELLLQRKRRRLQ